MTLHISRDLLERPQIPIGVASLGTGVEEQMGLYWIAIFLRYVLGFSVVGQTNFNLEGGTMTMATGTGAVINLGPFNEYAVSIPSGQYVLTGVDINRILILKSVSNPKTNSGLFRIVSVDTVKNIAYIDFASSMKPVNETMPWTICESDSIVQFNVGSNAGTGYRSNGTASCSRIILQSPHVSGWQVRLCRESTSDVANGLLNSSVAPGFGGDAFGDFPSGGTHLHHFLYHNVSNTTYRGTVVGVDKHNANWPARFYLWGDDVTGSTVVIARGVNIGGVGSPTTLMLSFGLTEDETIPLPSRDVYRLFVLGSTVAPSSEGINYSCDFGATFPGGSGFGLGNSPISACYSSYAKLTGQTSVALAPRLSTTAADNSFTRETELQTLDVIVGTYDNYDNVVGESILRLEPRRLGTAPFARIGRSISEFSLASDGTWIHLQNGVWLPWQPGCTIKP